jgi:Flp pilus assembly protein TadD
VACNFGWLYGVQYRGCQQWQKLHEEGAVRGFAFFHQRVQGCVCLIVALSALSCDHSAAAQSRQGSEAAVQSEEHTRAAYLEALHLAAGGDQQAAIAALKSLEGEIAADGKVRGINQLHRQLLGIARELAKRKPASLRPVLWLHYNAYRSNTDSPDPILVEASRVHTSGLAELLWETSKSNVDRALAVDVLLCQADALLEESRKAPATAVFWRVLRLEPDQPSALVALGALAERAGQAKAAVEHFRRLVAAHPDHAEGRLRLAINLGRLGEHEQADTLLRKLIAQPTPDWIKTIAYQELARSLSGADLHRKAEELLRRGIAELPTEQSLRLQLALVFDRLGRPADAADLVAGITTLSRRGGDTARWQYSRWPRYDRPKVELRLLTASTEASGHLGEALGGL